MLTVFTASILNPQQNDAFGTGMDVAHLIVEAQDHVSVNDRIEQLETDRPYPPDDVVDAEVKGRSCARVFFKP
jgi:hypothetical protein